MCLKHRANEPQLQPAQSEFEAELAARGIRFIPPLTVAELDCLWVALCLPNSRGDIPTREMARRLWRRKPNDLASDEFFEIVRSETYLRFRKYYNTNFKHPLERWLYVQTRSAALDFIKRWVPGFRFEKDKRPTAFVSLNEVIWTISDSGEIYPTVREDKKNKDEC